MKVGLETLGHRFLLEAFRHFSRRLESFSKASLDWALEGLASNDHTWLTVPNQSAEQRLRLRPARHV